MSEPSTILCIAGPTGSGKTSVGIEVALRMKAEIVSIDSRQLYRDFIIGTAQPTESEQRKIPHHLFNFHDARDPMTAGRFAKIARAKIEELISDGKKVILVGGSGLYYRAIFDGLFASPPTDPGYREALRSRAASEGIPALHAALSEIDPILAATIQPNDYPRIERGLEVFHVSGKPLSQWWQDGADRFRFAPRYFGLRRQRADTVARIAQRTKEMLQGGWIEEVSSLLAAGYGPAIEEQKYHGYREIAKYLAGEMSLAEVEEQINIVTRQYAKRQMTWFRKIPELIWIDIAPDDTAQIIADRILTSSF